MSNIAVPIHKVQTTSREVNQLQQHTNDTFKKLQTQLNQQIPTNTPTMTAWSAYTPTFTNLGTVVSIACFWRRVGDTIEIKAGFTVGTPVNATVTMSFPSTITSDKSGKITSLQFAGMCTSTVNNDPVITALVSSGQTSFQFGAILAAHAGLTPTTGTVAFTAGASYSFSASFAVNGWGINTG